MKRATCVLALVLVTVGVTTSASPTAVARQPEPHATDNTQPVWPEVERQIGLAAVFVRAVEAEQLAAFLVDVEAQRAEAERLAAEEAARARAQAVPARPAVGQGNDQSAPVTASGNCYAGPIPPAIVTRESGGNPSAVNASSGAYGCFQIMGYVWDANCADLSRDVAGQIACANRISNGGTNLAPWR